MAVSVGLAALGFSVLYFVSDVVELVQGGFSPGQLLLTYAAEAAIPAFVLGLYAVQVPRIGRLGLVGAVGYAYAFTYFTGTVLLALVTEARDWSALEDQLGVWVVVHGAVMVLAGLAFGLAVVRAGVLPRWTGLVLMLGVVLVAASASLPSGPQVVAAAVRDLGFAGMGTCVLLAHRRARRPVGQQRTVVPAAPPGGTPSREGAGSSVALYWLPLGAGGGNRLIRASGHLYEAAVARHDHRPRRALYHSALKVVLDGVPFVVEMTPVWDSHDPGRGVVAEGAVGTSWLGARRLFRYEIRRWRRGSIADIAFAVDSPRQLSLDRGRAARVLHLVPSFPTATWGQDELRTGEMWNSNSLTSWLLASSGHDTAGITPPAGGRAPGWDAGLVRAAAAPAAETSVVAAAAPLG